MLNTHANTSELKQQYNVPYPWKMPCCHQNVEDPGIHVPLTGCNIDKC